MSSKARTILLASIIVVVVIGGGITIGLLSSGQNTGTAVGVVTEKTQKPIVTDDIVYTPISSFISLPTEAGYTAEPVDGRVNSSNPLAPGKIRLEFNYNPNLMTAAPHLATNTNYNCSASQNQIVCTNKNSTNFLPFDDFVIQGTPAAGVDQISWEVCAYVRDIERQCIEWSAPVTQ